MEELPFVAIQHPLLLVAGLFGSLLLFLEIGRALGRLRQARGTRDGEGAGLIEGAVFALVGLLLALSFNAAASRFEIRRSLIVEEANAIGTARLRIDVLPASYRGPMNLAFDRYVRSRADAYRSLDDPGEFRAALARSAAIQQEIWTMAVQGGGQPDAAPGANVLLLSALNAMIDITTTRAMAMRMHTPAEVYLVLWITALAAALLAGQAMALRARNWIDIVTFITVVTLLLYVLLDLDYPRLGLVRVDSFDAILLNGAAPG